MNRFRSPVLGFSDSCQPRALIAWGLLAGVLGCGTSTSPEWPDDPAVKGPITEFGAPFVAGTIGLKLSDAGYEEQEYFISGTASSYTSVGELDEGGNWDVEKADTAEFNTRVLVYRPIDAAAFSGTVVMEWLNVSGGVDASPDWSAAHTEILREGHVWVGVSAQIVGIEGSGSDSSFGLHLKRVNPERYGELAHPGDSFSYDMYAQAAQAVRNPVDIKPLGELVAERFIAMGESQSAARLVTYVNALGPIYDVFDGYIIHSRGGGSAKLSQDPQAGVPTPEIVRVREDLEEPVLMFQTESDLLLLGSLPSNQPDSRMFRLWEVTGTAHADVYTLKTSGKDLGDDPSVAAVVETTDAGPLPGLITCEAPINSGPQHWVLKAGLHGLVEWIRGGEPLPEAPRLSVTEDGTAFQLDELGNVLGGIRTNYVDAPVAVLSGLGQTGDSFCRIFGTTSLFDSAQLAALYPTRATYLDAVRASVQRAVDGGYLLAPDAALILAWEEASDIGKAARIRPDDQVSR